MLRRFLVFILLLHVALWSRGVAAQSIEQDRRIEEEKRDGLKPTVTAPQILEEKAVAKERKAPPVPFPSAEIYFMHLSQRRIAFRYDGMKAIVILMGVDDEYLNLDAQVAYLRQEGFLPSRFRKTFDATQPLRKGLTAYMFRQALGIRGGIALHLFGPSERFALSELGFQGIMAPGNVNDLVSGIDLVQIMSQAAEHKAKQEAKRRP